MSKSKKKTSSKKRKTTRVVTPVAIEVESLLDKMVDGYEHASIVSLMPSEGLDLIEEVIKGLKEIESVRNRPCLAYVGNVVRKDSGDSGIDSTDDLPFIEMVKKVPAGTKKVDVFLATRGGSAHQVSRFVNCLRSNFEQVEFIIPSFCMSAGTLFALSGDKIWMTERACLGPIDPQVPTKDGRFVPAQALLLLVNELQLQGQQALERGMPIPWTAVRIIDSIDKKELGDAMTASHYSTMMASQFLVNYKFRTWTKRASNNEDVTPQLREDRAQEIANALASHDRWKNHGHAISRDVLWNEIKLRIEHPTGDFERSIIRLWALFNWIFDKTSILKMITSKDHKYARFSRTLGAKND